MVSADRTGRAVPWEQLSVGAALAVNIECGTAAFAGKPAPTVRVAGAFAGRLATTLGFAVVGATVCWIRGQAHSHGAACAQGSP